MCLPRPSLAGQLLCFPTCFAFARFFARAGVAFGLPAGAGLLRIGAGEGYVSSTEFVDNDAPESPDAHKNGAGTLECTGCPGGEIDVDEFIAWVQSKDPAPEEWEAALRERSERGSPRHVTTPRHRA